MGVFPHVRRPPTCDGAGKMNVRRVTDRGMDGGCRPTSADGAVTHKRNLEAL